MRRVKKTTISILQSFSNKEERFTVGRVVSDYRRAHFFNGQKRFNHFLNIIKLYWAKNWNGELRYTFSPNKEESTQCTHGLFGLLGPKACPPHFPQKTETTEVHLERSSQTKRIIVSDFDDTIIKSRATSLIRLIFTTLSKPIGKREVFPEVSNFYKKLQKGPSQNEDNLFFYISSSTWNIYPLLRGFLESSDLPKGILLLKEMTLLRPKFSPHTQLRHSHKIEKIQSLLDFYQDLPFTLIGDAGQEDAQIYQEIAQSNKGRIKHILIRHKWWERIVEAEPVQVVQSLKEGPPLIYFKHLEDIKLIDLNG